MVERRPKGYWQDPRNILAEARKVLSDHPELDRLPSNEELKRLRYSTFANNIGNYPGGMRGLRESLGEPVKKVRESRISRADYQNRERLLEELGIIMREHDIIKIPSYGWLGANGYWQIASVIKKFYGFGSLKASVNEEETVRKWQCLETTLREAKRAMDAEGWKRFPGRSSLHKGGYFQLSAAIVQYHGDYGNFRKLFKESFGSGEVKKRRSKGSWQSLSFVLDYAEEAMKSEGWEQFPGAHVLRKHGHDLLVSAIIRYHGKFPSFREKLRKHLGRPTEREGIEGLLDDYVEGGER